MRFQVLVSATGPAARVQWDRMGQFHTEADADADDNTDADADANMTPIFTGLYYATGQTLHGRQVYQHENWTQSIFYIYGEYDGWMLGPR